ncbi:MAG: ABC transporter ATP-binding protein, partial [Caldilineales bacterium]|nr:ABC transporter ATP-binding protein [Caldilineales bacterium]
MVPVLELHGITKQFPGVLANDHIDLTLYQGEILALLGENGAGKTTLMNILYGLYQPDAGEIFVRGKKIKVHSPNDAIAVGIGMVHQHFMLVPVLTVTENVMLGVESLKGGVFLDRRKAAARIREISEKFGLAVDPNAYIKDLPVGVQQRVEIIKLLYREADILILDEPTAVLTPQEADELFKIMRSLVAQGKSIIFITHKLREVLAVADRIVVLRQGRVVGEANPKTATQAQLATMMVGREVKLTVKKTHIEPGDVILRVENLKVLDDRDNLVVDGVSLEVRAGEIMGVAGVQGNGQTELVEALTGLRPVADGRVFINGHETTDASPRKILELGVAHVPEDRQTDGLVLTYP